MRTRNARNFGMEKPKKIIPARPKRKSPIKNVSPRTQKTKSQKLDEHQMFFGFEMIDGESVNQARIHISRFIEAYKDFATGRNDYEKSMNIIRSGLEFPFTMSISDPVTLAKVDLVFWVEDVRGGSEQLDVGVWITQNTNIENIHNVWNQVREWRSRVLEFNRKEFSDFKYDPDSTKKYWAELQDAGISNQEIANRIYDNLNEIVRDALTPQEIHNIFENEDDTVHYRDPPIFLLDSALALLDALGHSKRRAEDFVDAAVLRFKAGDTPFIPGDVVDAERVRLVIRGFHRKKKSGKT